MNFLHPLQNQRGVSLLVVLIAVTILGLTAGLAGSTWKTAVQRSREADLFFRGDQYRKAIESYYKTAHGGRQGMFPNKLEDLLRDPRTVETKRYIRKLYKDPMTGEDFEIIRAGGKITGLPGTGPAVGGIIGVRSTSSLEPFKKDGFPEGYESFAGADKYSDWEFVFTPPKPGQPGQPGQPGPGQTPQGSQQTQQTQQTQPPFGTSGTNPFGAGTPFK